MSMLMMCRLCMQGYKPKPVGEQRGPPAEGSAAVCSFEEPQSLEGAAVLAEAAAAPQEPPSAGELLSAEGCG